MNFKQAPPSGKVSQFRLLRAPFTPEYLLFIKERGDGNVNECLKEQEKGTGTHFSSLVSSTLRLALKRTFNESGTNTDKPLISEYNPFSGFPPVNLSGKKETDKHSFCVYCIESIVLQIDVSKDTIGSRFSRFFQFATDENNNNDGCVVIV